MDLNALNDRLENWARAQRSSGFVGGRACSAEGMFRTGYRESRAAPIPPDYADAQIVNDAWKRLYPLDKDVLMMHYVWRAPSSFICRRLKLKQGRGNEHIWTFALWHAQQAIAHALEKIEGEFVNRPNLAYTRAHSMTNSGDCRVSVA
jgi:toxin CptA